MEEETDIFNSLSLEPKEEVSEEHKNYFGEDARQNFFDRFRWLNHHTDISLTNRYQPLDAAYINNVPKVEVPELHLPAISETRASAVFSGRKSERGKQGTLSHDDEYDWTEHSVSTMSKQSFSVGNPPRSIPATPSSSANSKRKVYKFDSRSSTPNTRMSLPSISTSRTVQSDSKTVLSRRSYVTTNKSSPDAEDLERFLEYFNAEDFASHDEEELQMISPRTKFLASCIKEKINPRASLLLRKNMTTQLSLQHQGMSDNLARSFAKSLQTLPHLERLNVADNRLTDAGLTPILQAVSEIATLRELNLSQNKIGRKAAQALKNYLSAEGCPLESLVLNNANIDDSECSQFVQAILRSSALTFLDLSHNLIGKAEKVYSNKPGALPPPSAAAATKGKKGEESVQHPTGGHALAELLRSSRCKLHTLNLQWNLIRLDGAVSLSKALALNQTLVSLDLSYNALSTDGAMALGTALQKNNCLRQLNLSYNSIDSVGCLTLCAGIIENRSLQKVSLDGNPIGQAGGTALLMVPLLALKDVEISALRCNVTIKDPNCWFSFERVVGEFNLNMENGFDRAILIFLLHIIAGHQSLHIAKMTHELKGKVKPVALTRALSDECVRYLSDRQKELVATLERVQRTCSNYHQALRWFDETDTDGSGVLEFSEFAALMKKMGIEISEKRLQQLMKKYDIDSSGSIDMTGFLVLLKHQRNESLGRMRELQRRPIMKDPAAAASASHFIPPDSGVISITTTNEFTSLSEEDCRMHRVMTSHQCEGLVRVVGQMGSTSNFIELLSETIEILKLRYYEAITLADLMLMESTDKIDVTQRILLQVNDTHDTAHFLHAVFGDNRQEVMRFKWDYGFLLKPLLGAPNGFYSLDLAKEAHQKCFYKLLEINSLQTERRVKQFAEKFPQLGNFGDVSQKMNFSCFRNELLNGEPTAISTLVEGLPSAGKLEFDFTSYDRPPRDAPAISDRKFLRILLKYAVLKAEDIGIAMWKLEDRKERAHLTLGCNGKYLREVSMERAAAIGLHMEEFYDHLPQRLAQLLDTRDRVCRPRDGNKEILPRDSYPLPASLHDGFMSEVQHVEDAVHLSASTSPPRSPSKRKTLNLATALSSDKSFDCGEEGLAWLVQETPNGSALASPALQITRVEDRSDDEATVNEDDEEEFSIFDNKGQPRSFSNSPVVKAPPELAQAFGHKESSENFQKMKASAHRDDDDEDEPEAHQTEETRSWLQEYEMIRRTRISSFKRMKSRKLKDFIRRLAFLREKNFIIFPTTDVFLQRFHRELENPRVQGGLKAHKLVDLLEDVLTRAFLLCRQLALLLECFVQYGAFKQATHFGTYRVELAVSLYSRLLDIHNFELVLEVLSPYEAACVICRLGYLTVFNPTKPEGSYELNLARREERQVAKMLCILGIYEPGDNFINERFRWSRELESMPGWELTQSWMTEAGMPNKGLLTVTYYSGEGRELRGCKPYVSFRKALLSLVLLSEEELVGEEFRSRPRDHKRLLPGEKCFKKHIDVWENYLTPPLPAKKK